MDKYSALLYLNYGFIMIISILIFKDVLSTINSKNMMPKLMIGFLYLLGIINVYQSIKLAKPAALNPQEFVKHGLTIKDILFPDGVAVTFVIAAFWISGIMGGKQGGKVIKPSRQKSTQTFKPGKMDTTAGKPSKKNAQTSKLDDLFKD